MRLTQKGKSLGHGGQPLLVFIDEELHFFEVLLLLRVKRSLQSKDLLEVILLELSDLLLMMLVQFCDVGLVILLLCLLLKLDIVKFGRQVFVDLLQLAQMLGLHLFSLSSELAGQPLGFIFDLQHLLVIP